MSTGLCSDHCKSQGSVFAVLLGKDCWCSDYIPGSQGETSSCSDPCPGYPSDTCGNIAQSLYAYFQVGTTPSGTAGGSSPTSRTSSVSTIGSPFPGPWLSEQPRSSRTLSFVVSVLTSDVASQSSVQRSTSSLTTSTVSETNSSKTLSRSLCCLCSHLTCSSREIYIVFIHSRPYLCLHLANPSYSLPRRRNLRKFIPVSCRSPAASVQSSLRLLLHKLATQLSVLPVPLPQQMAVSAEVRLLA